MVAQLETRPSSETAGRVMHVKTVPISLADIGYEGWSVTMRTDPKSSVYDSLLSGDDKRWWAAFGQIVQSWTLTDDDGSPLPLPKTVEKPQDLDLRVGVLNFVLKRYFDAVREQLALPKASSDNSAPTSSTSDGSQPSG
jgi:hypothetical protein